MMSRSPALNAMAMTPPRSAPGQASKAGRPFNPATKYPVRLADRLREGLDKSDQIVTRIEVDPEIKFTGNSVEATVEVDPVDPENSAFLVISSKADNSKQQYRGAMSSDTNLYTLTFDPALQALILDRIDATITFSTERPASSGTDASASDSDDYGTPDPNNPYDWRHHLNQRDSSPEDASSLRSAPESYAGSPVPTHSRDFRKASSPPESVRSEAMVRMDSRTAASTPVRGSGGGGDDDDNLVFDFDTDDGDGGNGSSVRGRLPSKLGKGHAGRVTSLASIAHSRSTSRQPLSAVQRKTQAKNFDDDDDENVLVVEPSPSPPPRSQKSVSERDVDVSDIDIDGSKSPSLASQQIEQSPPPENLESEHEPEREPEHEPEHETGAEHEAHGASQPQPQARSQYQVQPKQQEEASVDAEEDDTFEHELEAAFDSPSSEEVSEEE